MTATEVLMLQEVFVLAFEVFDKMLEYFHTELAFYIAEIDIQFGFCTSLSHF